VQFGVGGREQRLFEPILVQSRRSDESEAKALEQLQSSGRQLHNVLFYGPYIIEVLYLEASLVTPQYADYAARIARVLITYWRERAAVEDYRAAEALQLLQRSYWRALAMILNYAENAAPTRQELEKLCREPQYGWLSGWYELLPAEYPAALRTWQAICLDAQTEHLFAERLALWLNAQLGAKQRSWQHIREAEVRALIWSDPHQRQLRTPGVTTAAGRRWLQQMSERWILSHYDVIGATRLNWQIYRAEGKPLVLALLLVLPIGASRLWAGSGIGLIGTMLQGDTWSALHWLVQDNVSRAVAVGVGLPLMSGLYLAYEIQQRAGVDALWRAVILGVKGELFALLITLTAAVIFGSFFLSDLQTAPTFAEWMLGTYLYAQIALTIGIFTQLIFDDRRITDPVG
jgi:hypothetical protein